MIWGSDCLSWQPGGDGEPEPVEENEKEDTIAASLRGIVVQQGPRVQRRETLYEPFVGLWLAEQYKGRWKVIGKYLRNMKQLERQILKEMQQSRLEATK